MWSELINFSQFTNFLIHFYIFFRLGPDYYATQISSQFVETGATGLQSLRGLIEEKKVIFVNFRILYRDNCSIVWMLYLFMLSGFKGFMLFFIRFLVVIPNCLLRLVFVRDDVGHLALMVLIICALCGFYFCVFILFLIK